MIDSTVVIVVGWANLITRDSIVVVVELNWSAIVVI